MTGSHTNPKQEKRKSYYEKQKEHRDLHRRRSLHPRDLREFIPGNAAAPAPQNYTGKLTHGEFVSCGGQILNPPAYSVGGTWVLNIDMMTQPQVPPPAHLTMVVFRDGRNYLVFPHIELTPSSLQDGVYTYTFGPQVTAMLDTNTTPATFTWHVEFEDNCTLRNYRSLTYVGLAN